MDNQTKITIVNRSFGSLGYTIPEMNISRDFGPKGSKEITFEELKALAQVDGGKTMIMEKLAVRNEEALKELYIDYEPEYFYSEEDVKKIMTTGSLDEFLDMLDFAPLGVLDIVKSLAITLPLNDVDKRDAILEKLSFNVSEAIKIRNTNFDDGSEDESVKAETKTRRTTIKEEKPAETTTSKRRVISKAE